MKDTLKLKDLKVGTKFQFGPQYAPRGAYTKIDGEAEGLPIMPTQAFGAGMYPNIHGEESGADFWWSPHAIVVPIKDKDKDKK